MGVKISALPTATEAEAASGLIPVVTDPNGDGNLVTKHITGSSIVGSGASVNTSATPPSNPSNGDLWFDEDNAELYIYNTSINGWIQTNGSGGSGGGNTSTGIGITGNISLLSFDSFGAIQSTGGLRFVDRQSQTQSGTSYTVDPAKTYRCVGICGARWNNDQSEANSPWIHYGALLADSRPIPVVTDLTSNAMGSSRKISNGSYPNSPGVNMYMYIYSNELYMFSTSSSSTTPAGYSKKHDAKVLIMESDS